MLAKIAAVSALVLAPFAVATPTQAAIADLPSYEQALDMLADVSVDSPATSDGYSRAEFPHWRSAGDGCDTRQLILRRDLTDITLRDDGCTVGLGTLDDPYTGLTIAFQHTNYPEPGAGNSNTVQIDHIIALCDAWKTGAQEWTREQRAAFANDPLNLIAADGPANGSKGCGNAHEWLPRSSGNSAFDCDYVTAQAAVKSKYGLWMAFDEKQVIEDILVECVGEQAEPGDEGNGEAPGTEDPGTETPSTDEPGAEDPGTVPAPAEPTENPTPSAPDVQVTEPTSGSQLVANTSTDIAPMIWAGALAIVLTAGVTALWSRPSA